MRLFKQLTVTLKDVDKKQEFDGRSFANIFHGYSSMDAVDKKHIAKLIPPFKPDYKTGYLFLNLDSAFSKILMVKR